MRRSRRGLSGGHEFGGSGEDSFVAVVVTKLTGALLFILLLTMVIMALIPKADEAAARARTGADGVKPTRELCIRTPEAFPEAIAGRPYTLALAADGASGPLRWAVDGPLPEGLALDREAGVIAGTPRAGTPRPIELVVRVEDGVSRAASPGRLVVYQPDTPLTTPSAWKPKLPPIPWRSWMEQGFGFLVLLLVFLVGWNVVGGLERLAATGGATTRRLRFSLYRAALGLGGLGAGAALAMWLRRG